MVTLTDIREARSRLDGITVRTPLIPLEYDGRTLYLKPENLQPIGAFKLRGAYNKIASLTDEERARGVITYSSGNHVGPSGPERQIKAEELAAEHGYVIVPPYDDEKIIAGQGTAGLEILEDLPEVELVLVPVGGGGLISGISTAIKLSKPSVKIIGVEPELAADAQASFRAGEIVKFPAEQVLSTCADGLRAQYVGTMTFEHIRRYVDDVVTVTEDEIMQAVRVLAQNPKTVAEPSGAVATAAFLFHRELLPASNQTVAVISGGNIDPDLLRRIRT